MNEVDVYAGNTPESIMGLLRQLLNDIAGDFVTGLQAFWISPPKAPEVGSGLAIILNRYPVQISADHYEWTVSLRQYQTDSAGCKTLEEASKRIRLRFAQHREQPSPFEEGSPIQIVFKLRFNRHAYDNY